MTNVIPLLTEFDNVRRLGDTDGEHRLKTKKITGIDLVHNFEMCEAQRKQSLPQPVAFTRRFHPKSATNVYFSLEISLSPPSRELDQDDYEQQLEESLKRTLLESCKAVHPVGL